MQRLNHSRIHINHTSCLISTYPGTRTTFSCSSTVALLIPSTIFISTTPLTLTAQYSSLFDWHLLPVCHVHPLSTSWSRQYGACSMKIIVQSRSSHFPLSRVSQLTLCLSFNVGILAAAIEREEKKRKEKEKKKNRRTRTKRTPRFRANEPLHAVFPSVLAYGSQDSHKIEQTSDLGVRGISWPSAAREKSSECCAQSLELYNDRMLVSMKWNAIIKHISPQSGSPHLNNVQTKYGKGSKCTILADCTFLDLFPN